MALVQKWPALAEVKECRGEVSEKRRMGRIARVERPTRSGKGRRSRGRRWPQWTMQQKCLWEWPGRSGTNISKLFWRNGWNRNVCTFCKLEFEGLNDFAPTRWIGFLDTLYLMQMCPSVNSKSAWNLWSLGSGSYTKRSKKFHSIVGRSLDDRLDAFCDVQLAFEVADDEGQDKSGEEHDKAVAKY